MSSQELLTLQSQITDVIIGSVFLFVGLAACAVAAIRRISGTRIFIWLGIWSAMYGAVLLTQSMLIRTVSPGWMQASLPHINVAMVYLLVVFGLLSFVELSRGALRRLLWFATAAGFVIAVAGIAFYVLTGSSDTLMLPNNLLAACVLALLTVIVAAPRLSARYLVMPERKLLATGTIIFGIEALYNSLSRPLGFTTFRVLDHAGFAILLASFGYVALRVVLVNEHRLLALGHELAIAREIQLSILPNGVPELSGTRISAAYQPMSEVAGDFYEFIPVDPHRAGFLVADVCGHGVPAALIASMVKVAVHMIADSASDPGALLRRLNRVLSRQLRGQLVTAAYLWVDTENHTARYSAAGHPPLLRWRDGQLERIESNGLLFGIVPDAGYPVHTMSIAPGDRFLLYTDGVIEPENAHGESFGEARLEHVLRQNQACPAPVVSDQLLSEIPRWQSASRAQQDDITLIVIDAV